MYFSLIMKLIALQCRVSVFHCYAEWKPFTVQSHFDKCSELWHSHNTDWQVEGGANSTHPCQSPRPDWRAAEWWAGIEITHACECTTARGKIHFHLDHHQSNTLCVCLCVYQSSMNQHYDFELYHSHRVWITLLFEQCHFNSRTPPKYTQCMGVQLINTYKINVIPHSPFKCSCK